jgi:hypothetical protein
MAGILRRLKLSRNEITNDEIKTKVTTKEYEEGYDRIFGSKSQPTALDSEESYNRAFKKKPQSLDAAYERRAMMQGLIVSPLFDENKELWSEEDEKRMDVVGSNGNVGYTITDIDNSNPWCTKVTVEENKD